jgi:hypothetical protein
MDLVEKQLADLFGASVTEKKTFYGLVTRTVIFIGGLFVSGGE